MKSNKFSIIFLSVIILFLGIYCINSTLDKNNKELTELEVLKIQEIQEEYFSKLNISRFNNPSKISETEKFYNELININELIYGDDLVIATVNGWDITLDEMIFVLALTEALEGDILINKQTYESYFDRMVKTKIYYSFALDKEVLPEETEVYELIDRDREIWNNEVADPFSEFLDEKFYWDNYVKHFHYGFITKKNVANYILDSIKTLDPYSEEAINYFNSQIQKKQNNADIDIIMQFKIP